MKLMSECVLIKEDDCWTALFPQFDDMATSGKTREEAIRNARELLEIEAADYLDENKRPPRMQHIAEVAIIEVDVTREDSEQMKCVTKAQAAEELEVSRPRITALISSGILETKSFSGKEFVSLESVNQYRNSQRTAGRPKKILNA